MSNQDTDRYISFCNIECDQNADLLISFLDKHLDAGHEKNIGIAIFVVNS